jgi:hypothetical protein
MSSFMRARLRLPQPDFQPDRVVPELVAPERRIAKHFSAIGSEAAAAKPVSIEKIAGTDRIEPRLCPMPPTKMSHAIAQFTGRAVGIASARTE